MPSSPPGASIVTSGISLGHRAGSKARVELLFSGIRSGIRMEAAHKFLGKKHLGIARIPAFGAFLLQAGDFSIAAQAQQIVPVPHQRVGNGHHLAEHVVRGIRNADVVVLALASS